MTGKASGVTIDDAAVLWSVPANAGPETPLIVLLHGRGSHEGDLFSLRPLLPKEATVASLRAPFPLGDGWSWFISGEPGRPDPSSAIDSTNAVLAWLDRIGARGPVVVMGFSQGGAMTVQLLRHAAHRFVAFVNFAGFLVPGAGSQPDTDAALAATPSPVFWGRDLADPVIPADAISRTLDWLPAHSALERREYDGIGHSISVEEVGDAVAFLVRIIGSGD